MIKKEDIQKFKALFKRNDIMIVIHRSPDGDTLGSGFALKRLLELHGKRVTVVCSDEVPKKLDFFSDGKRSLTPEFEPQTIVTVDTATPSLMGEKYENLADKVWLAIDHHATNVGYAQNTVLYPNKSSVGELLADLIFESGFEYNKKIAKCLYGAISFDTGCFKFSNVKPETHITAARLLTFGFNAADMNRKMFDMAPLKQLKAENELIQNAELYCDGKIALVILTQKMIEKAGASDSDFEGLTAVARRIEGAEIGITMREMSNGDIRISLRSECDIDVSQIANKFGGGGHVKAAGCTIGKSVEDAKKMIVDAVIEAING